MNVLKIALIVCSLSAAAARAQTATPAPEQQVAITNAQTVANVTNAETQRRVAAPAAKEEECVGPVSYCKIYFGS
jgi:hypothetical protein